MDTISWWRIKLGENEAKSVVECIKNEKLSQGTITNLFEEQFAKAMNVKYAVATTSGSMALLMALLSLGIGHNDEVIVPDVTFVATAHAALMLGARVIFADTKNDIPVIDTAEIKKKITSRTKAIMAVHLNGRSVDIEDLRKISKDYGIAIVEDACQAMFSKNANGYLGTQSDAGCYSFGVSKLITTAQGGMVVTNREDMYEKLKLIRTHGVSSTFDCSIYPQFGFNFKFTDIQAAIGLEQLKLLSHKIDNIVKIYTKYEKSLKNSSLVRFMPLNTKVGEIPLYVDVLCKNRNEMIEFLNSRGIQSRPMYPNLHKSPYMKNNSKYPNSEYFQDNVLYLPSGPDQEIENVEKVINAIMSLNK